MSAPAPPPGRRLYIMSDAGKPIWASTTEPEHALAPLAGLVTAVLGFAASGGDALKAVVAGTTSAVVIVRGAVVLLAVSPYGETEAFLALLLEALYHQILFTLTGAVQKKLRASASYDLRDLLGGTQPVLAGLVKQGHADAGLMAGAVKAFPLEPRHRAEAGRVLVACRAGTGQDVLYGVLLVGGRVLTVLQPKEPLAHRLQPADLRLMVNFVQSQSSSLKGTESWTPLCLPRFNANGYLYSYVGYVDEPSDLCLMLVSAQKSPDTFLTFQTWKGAITDALEREGVIQAVRQSKALAARPGNGDDKFLNSYAQLTQQAAAVAAAQPSNAARTAAAASGGAMSAAGHVASQEAYANAVARADVAATAADLASQHKPLHFLYMHRPGSMTKVGARSLGTSSGSSAAKAAAASGSLTKSSSLTGLGSEPSLPQYICPAQPAFPYSASEESAMCACVSLQESVLRLRHHSILPEATLAAPTVLAAAPNSASGSVGASAEQPVAAAIFECEPVNPVCVHRSALSVVVGLSGDGYELHALFPSSLQPAEALAAAQHLIAAIHQEAPSLFIDRPPAY